MVFRLLGMIVAACLPARGHAQAQGKTEVLWYSQAAFKITTPGGKVIMIDPWIMGATKIPPELKDLGKIGKVDLILVTHGHGDHLGDALEISKTNNAPIWAPAGMNQWLATLGKMPANLVPRMNKGGTIEPFPGVKITMTHAEHSSEMILKDRRPARTRAIRPASRAASSSRWRTASRSTTWATRACSAT